MKLYQTLNGQLLFNHDLPVAYIVDGQTYYEALDDYATECDRDDQAYYKLWLEQRGLHDAPATKELYERMMNI